MTTYSRMDRLAAIQKAGFENPLTALAVSLAEFGENRDINAQGQSDIPDPNGINGKEPSFGPWQIHLPSHPDVTQSCALDLSCSTSYAYGLSKGGQDFSPWSAFTNGSYSRFIDELKSLLPPSPLGAGGSDSASSTSSTPSATATAEKSCPPGSKLINGVCYSGGGFGPSVDFLPNLPTPTPGAKAPQVGDVAKNIGDAIANAKSGLDLAKALTASENLWRAGFIMLGAAMIFFGARLYFTPAAEPAEVSNA